MYAKSRKTNVGQLLEIFLDDYKDDLPPKLFLVLEELTDRLDLIEDDFEERIEELNYKNDSLISDLQELKEHVEDLEYQLEQLV